MLVSKPVDQERRHWGAKRATPPNAILASFSIRLELQSFFQGCWRVTSSLKILNVVLVFWIDQKMFVWYHFFDCVIDTQLFLLTLLPH